MIEAVNSVLQNAPLVRGNAEQASTADSFAVNPERVQRVPQAPFVSPHIVVDVNFNKAVIQIRDGETGDVVNQFPSESRLREGTRQVVVQQEVSVPDSNGGGGTAAVSQSTTGASGVITAQQQAAFESAARTATQSTGAGTTESQGGDTTGGDTGGDTGSTQGSSRVTVFA